jgi:hypothetical protein
MLMLLNVSARGVPDDAESEEVCQSDMVSYDLTALVVKSSKTLAGPVYELFRVWR